MHKASTAETRERRKRVMNNAVKLYSDYLDSYEETYDEEGSNEKEELQPKEFKITGMEDTKLLKWLESRNDFNEAKKFISDIRIDISNVKVGFGNKKLFNDLNRLTNDK